jgi:NitT/TauT family transport system substrate-binding protein
MIVRIAARERTMRRIQRLLVVATVALALAMGSRPAPAATNELRIARSYDIHYLPLYLMQSMKLVEKHAAAAGLAGVRASYRRVRNAGVEDAVLSGALDIGTDNAPGFLVLWDRTKGVPDKEMRGLAAIASGPLWLMTRNPDIRTLADIRGSDRIAIQGKRWSHVAVVLRMMAAHAFGKEEHARLDPLTVDVPNADAVAAMRLGRTEINLHFAPPPYAHAEADMAGVHRVIKSSDVFGRLTATMAYCTKRFHDANPILVKAFIAALDEATKFVAGHRREAARVYNDFALIKAKEADLLRMLADPDMDYTIAPEGIMKYAEFMHGTGMIRHKPASWKELFYSDDLVRPGN